ncbi:MAG: hypothetical protein KGY65_06385 [Candidatus Thermoplasmatota archaeon]|nr:hypothetical protein [Candidatus Thermoplasmatota archaeon]MBS3802359.1 hypothetical protein [Candidatus Thermoplasmatota archaeon]
MIGKKVFGFGKKLLIFQIILVFSLLALGSMSVNAHSPSSMSLTYDKAGEMLTVDIMHQISNPSSHYVNTIEITINGVSEIEQSYTDQPSSSFTYTYNDVSAEDGDVIEVTASCNQGGSITDQLTVSGDTTSGSDEDSETPGFELVLVCASVIAVLFIFKRKR